jgi:hypothetical protein
MCTEEPYARAVMFDGLDADRSGEMRLARSGAADQESGGAFRHRSFRVSPRGPCFQRRLDWMDCDLVR